MIWYALGSRPAVACVCPEIAQGGVLEEPLGPREEIWWSVWFWFVNVCLYVKSLPFATCMWVSTVIHVCPGGKTLIGLQMNFNLKKRSFVSCSNLFGCGFLSECFFFPSGRCVVVGGSCRMEEHSLLSDSPCSWRLRYPMSLFTDNVFISICFMCN